MKQGKKARSADHTVRYGIQLERDQRQRVWFLLGGFLLAFLIIGWRLCNLHLNPGLELSEEERNHIGTKRIEAPRGEIRDRCGIILANQRTAPSVWVDPREVRDPEKMAAEVAAYLDLDPAVVLQRMTKKRDSGELYKFVWLKRWVTNEDEAALKAFAERFPKGMINIEKEKVRNYPQQDTAAHLLGFVNRAGEASEGLELRFDKHLKSVAGEYQARKDADRRLLPSEILAYESPKGGESIYLTIDVEIQNDLEDALAQRMVECKAPRGMGIIMDPHTGAILAMASQPAFDPNQYADYAPELRKNRGVLDVFEPGSSFKIVTAAAVLEHRIVTPETIINCEGGRYVPHGRRVIRDFHKMGEEPFSKCFAESSNIAMVKLGAALGPEQLDEWIRRFGFGQRTSRDFDLESEGLYRPMEQWSGFTMGSLPMGQEIAVTMPQLAKAFAVIANGGFVVEPYFVDYAVDPQGEISYQHRMLPKTRILSESTIEIMQDLCHQVVLHGTGEQASIPEYRVGGKTGTAQMASKTGRGYDPDRYTTVFAGFAPVAAPRLVGVIVIQEPMIRLHYGGYVCGPVFKEVMRKALVRLQTPLDPVEGWTPEKREAVAEKVIAKAAPASEGEDVDTVAERVDPEDLDTDEAFLLAPLELVLGEADKSKAQGALPDFSGMTKGQVRQCLWKLGIPWDPRGAGWAVSQEPEPGASLQKVRMCIVNFETKLEARVDDAQRTL